MFRTWLVWLLAVLLSAAGAMVSYMLLAKHLVKETGAVWFDAVCDGGEDSNVSCDEVLASPYGVFPPLPPDTEPEEQHVPRPVVGSFELRPRPVALFGLMYFIALLGWYVGVGVPSRSRRWFHLLPLLLSFCGAAGSAWLTYLMFAGTLEAWCPWCMVTHALNWLLLLCGILLWPRRPQPSHASPEPRVVPPDSTTLPHHVAAGPEPGPGLDESSVLVLGDEPDSALSETRAGFREAAEAPPIPQEPPRERSSRPRPSLRLVIVTLAAVTGLCAAEWFF